MHYFAHFQNHPFYYGFLGMRLPCPLFMTQKSPFLSGDEASTNFMFKVLGQRLTGFKILFIMQMGDNFVFGACYQKFTDKSVVYGSPVLLDSARSNNILALLVEPEK